ncbi:MAG: glycosyltransferase family 4 protein [Muribaculaceae bacterium]|nr:glycosyltransferase family 4 protein [Muribaculaceae bacterium]
MKIGYDGKRAVQNNTGLGNYSRLLAEVLAARYPANSYTLYAPRRRDNPRLAPVLERAEVSLALPDTAFCRSHSSLWRVWGITPQLVRDGMELFHGLSGELPLNIDSAGIPSVVTVHDLIFRHFPGCYAAIDRTIYDFKFRRAARQATRVIAISECTARDLTRFYGIDPGKIDVVYQGCAAQFRRRPSDEEIAAAKARYGLSRPYVISVGTIEERKNQLLAAKGAGALPEGMEVVLVGRRTPYAAEIENYCRTGAAAGRVRIIDNAAFADLPALYAGAVCSSYASRFEGFGIPVIESLGTGTPVIVATGSCLEEASGPSAPAIDPDDVQAWVQAVRTFAENPETRSRIAAEGREYASRFSDESMAEGTMRSYMKAIESFRSGHQARTRQS